MKFEDIKKSIDEKLGEEISAKISDDMASLITLNDSQLETIKERDNEISTLKKDKETLIKANGNLLKQVSMSKEEPFKEEENEEKKPFSYKSIFDEKGNFIR